MTHYDNNLVWRGFSYSGGSYTAIDDPLAGTSEFQGTVPVGINNKGQIVGYYKTVYDVDHGFLYDPTTSSFITFDNPNASMVPGTGLQGTALRGINDAGELVGTYADSVGNLHGFIFSSGTYTTIDDPFGVQTLPTGINSAGQIVGWYTDSSNTFDPSTIYHGFQYQNGKYLFIFASD